MENNLDLLEVFDEQCKIVREKTTHRRFQVTGLKPLKVRDILYTIGRITFADVENEIYIAVVRGGFFRMNRALVAIQWNETYIDVIAYAREGLFNQRTREGAIDDFKRAIAKYRIEPNEND